MWVNEVIKQWSERDEMSEKISCKVIRKNVYNIWFFKKSDKFAVKLFLIHYLVSTKR